MSACTFFGHRECYGLEESELRAEIEKLIRDGVDTFYVGNHGMFDTMVRKVLRQLEKKYTHITCSVVLAYLPAGKKVEDMSNTIYPAGLELQPLKFAIEYRNKWMIEAADYCLCYVCHSWGGVYKFAELAERRGLRVINLGNMDI